MTPTEVAAILRQLNAWRRCDKNIRLPDPRDIGEAIDAAIEMIERLKAAESDALEQARLNDMGSKREAALMAKLEAAERERDECNRRRLEAAKRHGAQPAPSVPDDIVREVLRDCCGTFHGSRHRITCEKYKGKKAPEAKQ